MKSKYQQTLITTICAGLILATNANANELSGNIGVTSNYLWRGVTQTQDAVAVQGGIDFGHNSGFYAGTWLSNVDFGDETSYELDLYAGYSGSINDELSYDVSYLYYAYPDATADINFGELTLGINWQWLTLSYSHTLHGDNDIASSPLDKDDMRYLQANISIPVSETISLDLHYGDSQGDIVESWFGQDSYSDYSVSLTKSLSVGDISLAFVDTDLPNSDAKALVSYNYAFDL